jgi:uncharacterized protein (DUF2336 family)
MRTEDERTLDILHHEMNLRREMNLDSPAPGRLEAIEHIEQAMRGGALDEALISKALSRDDLETIVAALVALAKLPDGAVRRILFSGSTGSVTALVRRAGFGIKIAYRILGLVIRLSPARPPSAQRKRSMRSGRRKQGRLFDWAFAFEQRLG